MSSLAFRTVSQSVANADVTSSRRLGSGFVDHQACPGVSMPAAASTLYGPCRLPQHHGVTWGLTPSLLDPAACYPVEKYSNALPHISSSFKRGNRLRSSTTPGYSLYSLYSLFFFIMRCIHVFAALWRWPPVREKINRVKVYCSAVKTCMSVCGPSMWSLVKPFSNWRFCEVHVLWI